MSSSGGLGRGTLPTSYVFSIFLMFAFSLDIMCLVGSLCGSSLDSHYQRARFYFKHGGKQRLAPVGVRPDIKNKNRGSCVGARLAMSA